MSADLQTSIAPKARYFTSHQVGDILQVNPSSVVKWINDGILPSFRTPGGHRRIAANELVRFAEHYGMPVPEQLRGLARTNVLVVDDEPRFLSALRRGLEPFEDELGVLTADNGIEALVMIGSRKPDILILDLRMPFLDGLQVFERLREREDTRGIRIILMSGDLSPDLAERCLKRGAVACLEKPVRVAEMVQLLRDVRRGRTQSVK
ncbi:MAG TPA: response regulator [Myxococcales bacterium]|nr:response regulator [Myxococcales bacterium]